VLNWYLTNEIRHPKLRTEGLLGPALEILEDLKEARRE
jgi:hypothetical protein